MSLRGQILSLEAPGGGTNKRTDERTNGRTRIPPVFYRTSSPSGAAAQKGVGVSFTLDMNLTITKDAFLNNHINKQRFIQMLGEKLTDQGSKVFHDKGDADLLIVKKTIQLVASMDTVLVGDDTDLLMLLISHSSLDASHDIFFASE